MERTASVAHRIDSLVLPSTTASSHVRACSVCEASRLVPKVWVVNVERSTLMVPRDWARSPGTTSSVPAAAEVSPTMCSERPGMSTCVVLFGSMEKCQALAAGAACDDASAVADGAWSVASALRSQPAAVRARRRRAARMYRKGTCQSAAGNTKRIPSGPAP